MTTTKRRQPLHWTNTVGAAISEGLIDLALISINNFITPSYPPAMEHVQLLLYLLVTPEDKVIARAVRTTSEEVPSPLAVLNRMLDEYGAHVMGRYLPPAGREILRSDGKLARSIERRFRRARSVWDLVFETPERKRRRTTGTDEGGRMGKRRARGGGEEGRVKKEEGEEDDGEENDQEGGEEQEEGEDGEDGEEEEEEEEEEEPEQHVSEGGWVLLSWLTRLWQQDSDSFTRSLPQYTDLLDDASLPLLVVREALEPASFLIRQQRGRIASSLLTLLVELASGPAPSFHPHSLVVSIVALLRRLERDELRTLFALSELDPAPESHLLALALEERAGTRRRHSENRRRGKLVGFEKGDWGPPTVRYALQLAREADDTGAVIATRLVSDLGRLHYKDEAWADVAEVLDDVEDEALRLALQTAQRRYENSSP